uniref:Uncharacterized protein n=1 Tax=Branchiostoma floridae TaxID=7739 RepID=C3ZKD8_BRAFL|eukprot:XP_002591026.1 hypothetical protein BRAFLDRAFT_69421 [Branchiostoma floridae]
MRRLSVQKGQEQGEDPAYVTPNDAHQEPVYVNPAGDLDIDNVIYEPGAGDEPRYMALKPDAAGGMKQPIRVGGEGSEQPRAKEDVLAADDSGVTNRLHDRITDLERGFRKLSLTLGLMYLVNVALVIYITVTLSSARPAYQPVHTSQPARQPPKADDNLTALKDVAPAPNLATGGFEEFKGILEATLPNQTASDARGSPTTPNSLTGIKDPGFKTATFTTLNTTGRAGPTSLGDHYRGQDHEKLVTLQNGIQLFTVPEDGNYSIKAAGAAGGVDSLTVNASARGRGAVMQGTFQLRKGEVLKILVGQEGVENLVGFSAGGGGGTFVTRLDDTPLIIAGGGGGIEWLDVRYPSCDGTTLTSGQKSYKGGVGRVGSSDDEVFAGGTDGHGATAGWGKIGGGGGGLLTNGGSGWDFAAGTRAYGGEGGYAFVNGGLGGRGLHHGADGGFGGGGGAQGGGKGSGGGGGYSGGGRGPTGTCECGGGGGSFNAGTDTTGKNGTNAGPGYAVIVRLFD